MIDYEKMLPYCQTSIQTKTIQAVIQTGSITKAARDMGKNRSTVRECVDSIHARAAREESDLLMDDGGKVAPGRVIGKTTHTLKDPLTGERQWVRTDVDGEIKLMLMEQAIKGLMTELAPIPKIKEPKKARYDESQMVAIPVGDPHVGLLATTQETLCGDWDLPIAVRTHAAATDDLMQRAPRTRDARVVIMGDLMHFDGMKAMTAQSGNMLDTDTRYPLMFRTATAVVRRMIDEALKKHFNVEVIIVKGNHDESSSICLSQLLEVLYANNSRCTIIPNDSKFIPSVWESNFSLYVHGDGLTDKKKMGVVTSLFKKEHGNAEFTHVIAGHLHHAKVIEDGGMTLEIVQALPNPDAWHSSSGFVTSDQAMTCHVYRAEGGIAQRLTHYPRFVK